MSPAAPSGQAKILAGGSPPSSPGRLGTALLVLAGGLLWLLAMRLYPLAASAWLAPLCVLAAARSGRAFLCGASAALIGQAGIAAYYTGIAGPGLAAMVASLTALQHGLCAAIGAAALRRLRPLWAVWVYPLAMAGTGFAASLLSPHGTSGSLVYSQMEFLPVLQAASLGGTPAVVFLVMLPAAGIATLVYRGRKAWPVCACALALTACALAWGGWRLTQPLTAGPTVALLATDRFEGIPKDIEAVKAAYFPAIDQAIAAGARIIVLPEKIARTEPATEAALAQSLAAKAQAAHATIVVGVLSIQPDGTGLNRAITATPSGQLLTYAKQHLVPGWEQTLRPGHTALLLPPPQAELGVAICKDMDFAPLGQDYARKGARLMLVPAWDFADWWGADGYAHGRLAVLRGVEGGFTVARAPRQGLLTLSDRTGRVRAEQATGQGVAQLVAEAPLGAPTLYARIGDVFGAACLALTALALLALQRKTRS